MAALARYRPRPLATFTPVSQRSKYQHIRMKDMLRSALGVPPGGGGGGMYSAVTPSESMGTARSLAMGMMGAPSSATAENFPGSAGGMGYGAPLSASLDGSGGMGPGSRRQSSIAMQGGGGPRQILPGQLPGPGPQQRKSSIASVASAGAS
jgi:SAGA-associated factor 73